MPKPDRRPTADRTFSSMVENVRTRQGQQEQKKPADFDRRELVDKMRESVQLLGHHDGAVDMAAIETRLAVCLKCRELLTDGCRNCQSCATRWTGWRKKLIAGNCSQFPSGRQAPQLKGTDGMLVYEHEVIYATDGKTPLVGVVIAGQTEEAIATIRAAVPGAEILGVNRRRPVMAIAASLVPGSIDLPPPQPIPAGPAGGRGSLQPVAR